MRGIGLLLPVTGVLAAMALAATGAVAQSPPTVALPAQGQTAGVPIGEMAGGAASNLAAMIDNKSGSQDVAAGRMLFDDLNCAGCHGYEGKGGMGPNLTDNTWRFGGTPAAIFKSIFEGRPQGMPAWGKALPEKDIWQLVAFIQSLGGTASPQDYQHALQGDEPGELVAPEIGFEQSLDGPPPYPTPPAGKSGVPYPEKQP